MVFKEKTIFCILTTVQIICVRGSFYMTTTESKWTEPPYTCHPATPDIDFEKSKYHLKINDLEWNDAGSAWTGYYKATVAFEYTGCAERDDIIKFKTFEQEIDKDPSQCFPRCEMTDTIGVTKEKCYCLQNSLPKNSTGHDDCTDECKFPKGIACGGASSEYVSIYTINPEVPTEPEDSDSGATDAAKSCLSMKKGSGSWTKCDTELTYKHSCRTANSTRIDRDFSGLWFNAAKFCFNNHEYPVGYSDTLLSSNGVDEKVWTGVFKMNIIFRRILGSHVKESPIVKGYGFIEKVGKKYTLDFTGEDGNRKILCDSEKNDQETTEPDHEELKKTTTQPEMSTGQPSPDTSTGSGTAVGICITVILIIAAIIASVVIVRKRYINSHRFDKMSESSVTGPDHEYNYPNYAFCREPGPNSPVRTTCTEESVRNNTDGAEYNYLDFSIQNAQKCTENTPQYTDISETSNSAVVSNIIVNPYSFESAYKVRSNTSCEDIPYNKTCGRNKVGLGGIKINNYDKLSGNSYDVLSTRPTFESEKTYATTSEQESPAAATNTYDTSLQSNEKLKQSQGGFTNNIYVVNSDTYNILGDETKLSKTDQLYGVKQLEKFKDILKPGGNENVYNTTSGQSETITVTDNPYAKLGQ